jgi:hypothetical protein
MRSKETCRRAGSFDPETISLSEGILSSEKTLSVKEVRARSRMMSVQYRLRSPFEADRRLCATCSSRNTIGLVEGARRCTFVTRVRRKIRKTLRSTGTVTEPALCETRYRASSGSFLDVEKG